MPKSRSTMLERSSIVVEPGNASMIWRPRLFRSLSRGARGMDAGEPEPGAGFASSGGGRSGN